MRTLVLVTVILSLGNVIGLTVLLLRRIATRRREQRRLEVERRLRPMVLAVVSGVQDEPDIAHRDLPFFSGLLGRYSQQLTGESRRQIAAFFVRGGMVAKTRRELRSMRAGTRAGAAFQLGDMGSPEALDDLIDALEDRRLEVRIAAARSLGRIGDPRATGALLRSLTEGRLPDTLTARALLMVGPSCVAELTVRSDDDDPRQRAAALELIGLLGDTGSQELLLGRLQDEAPEVRAAAIRALGRVGAYAATTSVLVAADDPVPEVRIAVAESLARIGDRRAVPAMLTQAQQDLFDPAAAAASALGAIDPACLAPAAARDDASIHVREAAALVHL